MSALQKLIDVTAEDELYDHLAKPAAAELAALQARVEAAEAERRDIAKSIKVSLADGSAPDNLAACVSLLMIQEYDPAFVTIDRLTAEVRKLREALAEILTDSTWDDCKETAHAALQESEK
jgi:hypothetical protein